MQHQQGLKQLEDRHTEDKQTWLAAQQVTNMEMESKEQQIQQLQNLIQLL